MGFFEGAMDIDLPTEIGPTEETVEALMEYLVGPLLPLKQTDITKKSLSEAQHQSVAKQVHAAAVLYNYYHLNQHRDLEFLKFDQFCNLAIMFKPSILHYMKYMSPSDRPTLTEPATQLSPTEKAIMDACNISETLLDASANVSSMIQEWPITKVAVLLIDSKKENCFLKFNDGVWSVIEKDLYPEESTNGIETKKSKKRKLSLMKKYDEEGEVGLQQLVFSAVKEEAGIDSGELQVLESHVVYSLSQAKTATRFYIVQSTKSINEDNLVPIQDAIYSLQGPVVTKSAGSWVITPVVEYYYLLPYADIVSKFFSRGSNGIPHQAIEGSAAPNIILGSLKSCNNVEIKSKLNSVNINISNISKEEPRDSKVAKKTHESNKQDTATIATTTLEPVNKVADDVNTSGSIESLFDQKVTETEYSTGNRITGANIANVKPEDMIGSSGVESSKQTHESKKTHETIKQDTTTTTTVEPASKVVDDVITSGSIESPFDQKVKETENSTDNTIMGVNIDNAKQDDMIGSLGVESSKQTHESKKTHETIKQDTTTTTTVEPANKVADAVITSGSIESPFDQKVKETENSTGNRITGVNIDNVKQDDMNGSRRAESSNSSSGANNKDIDKPPVSLCKENQNTKPQTPLKVYRHEKRTISNKKEEKDLKTKPIECQVEKIDGEKKPCVVSPHEDNKSLTVNHALVAVQQKNDGSLEDFKFTVDAKRSELSEAALRALLNKRQKLFNQQHLIESELALCDKKIQAIMNSGIGDCLDLKLEAVIDCCNEICQQNDTQAQDHTNVHVGSSLPLSVPSSGKSLSEAQLTLRKACQELDDICLSNKWMLPTYRTTRSDGGFVANVSLKGTNFECSGLSAMLPSVQEARNSAATNVITKLQQLANEHNNPQL
ncbi:hypothetical protein CTI12_AA056850 [Artemisia annua]|uniref:DRBM domain-containing protein n=1 Tax=Artemisia annua TaxID=35608 RepID=A0A2U1Q9Q3_ARTAN|nr:hypothetical protein CTI12_AA056850 [Artemisia annua]